MAPAVTDQEAQGSLPKTPTDIDVTRTRALNRKLDVALLPLLSLLYLFNGLDRGNVGNAETQGMLTCYVLDLSWNVRLMTNRLHQGHWRTARRPERGSLAVLRDIRPSAAPVGRDGPLRRCPTLDPHHHGEF